MTGSRSRRRRIVIDQTNLRGHVTGIERVALGLFSAEALAPHRVETARSGSLLGMILRQQVGLAARGLADRDALLVCPGFPPAPLTVATLGRRCIVYVHDTFLLTRPEDLSWKARLYMSPSFRFAVRRGSTFLANSETTAAELRRFTRPEASIDPLRPAVADVFGLASLPSRRAWRPGETLRILAIGTIEPRKGYGDAIEIVRRLNAAGVPARLDIVGRVGWGRHPFLADPPPFLQLHHGLDDAALRELATERHLLLSTSKAEGLGLPLLEVQHGGLPVVAPQGAVFSEVLGGSGLLIAPTDPDGAAAAIRDWAATPDALARAADASRANVARWNRLAAADRARFLRRIETGEL